MPGTIMFSLRGMLSFGRTRRIGRWLHHNLPPMNFITLHYSYFIGTSLVGAIIFWGSSTPPRSVGFTDSLFLVVSAMTLAGLNTVNLSTLNTFQQFMLFLMIMLGSTIFVSAFIVHIRRKAFERKFHSIEEERETRGRSRSRVGKRLSFSLSRQKINLDMSLPHFDTQTADKNGECPSGQMPDVLSDRTIERTSHDGQEKIEELEIAGLRNGELQIPEHSRAESEKPPFEASRTVHYDTDGESSSADHRSSGRDGTFPPKPESISGNSLRQPFQNEQEHISFHPSTIFRIPSPDSPKGHRHHRFISMQGVGARPTSSLRTIAEAGTTTPSAATGNLKPSTDVSALVERTRKYLPFSGIIGRNSQFHHMTESERERLGGVEYKAIQFLSALVPVYFVLWQLIGCLGIGAYVANNRASTARENGLNPFWVGAFNAVSAFNNSGMSLLDANMVAFQASVYMLIHMSLLILAGNTCYPIFLRLIVWSMRKMMPDDERWKDYRNTLQFLLDHPRRCYTHMFPSQHTWWLLMSVICLNGIDWAAFEILNVGNPAINRLSPGIEVIDGLFQAFAVRSGGFYVVPIPSVRISLQVLYVLMMYISVYPVVITMRNSNVYEERSLGIYADDPGYNPNNPSNDPKGPHKALWRVAGVLRRQLTGEGRPEQSTKGYFVRQQLRAQLAHDLWWLSLAIFLIMVVESSQFDQDPATFSVFNVIFETVSAYGCVGISVGLPNEAYSFCGAWHKLSKLILCAVMLRGRHRGLPVAIDKAVLLPGEILHRAEEEDAQIRLERSMTRERMV